MDKTLYKEIGEIKALSKSNNESLTRIDHHLETLNGKVARHERDIGRNMVDMSNILGQMNLINTNVSSISKGLDKKADDHETRLRGVEKQTDHNTSEIRKWITVGIVSVGIIEIVMKFVL